MILRLCVKNVSNIFVDSSAVFYMKLYTAITLILLVGGRIDCYDYFEPFLAVF